MPELPEVETMRRHIEHSLAGRVLRKLEIRLERVVLWPPGLGPGELEGATLRSARRRAKWLLLEFDNGLSLAVHFGLTGQLFHDGLQGKAMLGHPVPALDVPRPHKSTHAIFHFDDDSTLYYTDIRQFGRIHVVPTGEIPEFLGRRKLGVEPLTDDFQPAILENAASRRPRSKVKALLLDQRVVAGIGNIYADESLHRSGLHPAQQLAEVTSESLGRLRLAIIEVLRDAVENGVAEVVNGKAKPDARLPRVHGRQGEPCPRCGAVILKATQDGRGTYWCPECQSKD